MAVAVFCLYVHRMLKRFLTSVADQHKYSNRVTAILLSQQDGGRCILFVCSQFVKSIYFTTLVDFQLDAQNSYLFTYNTFIKILYMFRALPCSSSGGLRRNGIYAASDIVTVSR